MPSPGYRVSEKEVEVRDSGSRHHQLCGCCDLQLIQSRAAPSHGPPARVLFPLFFLAKSFLLRKPCGKKKHSKTTWSSLLSFRTSWFSSFPSEPHGPLLTSPKLPDPGPLSFPSEPRGTLLFYFRTTWTSIYLLASEPRGSLSLWLPRLRVCSSSTLCWLCQVFACPHKLWNPFADIHDLLPCCDWLGVALTL